MVDIPEDIWRRIAWFLDLDVLLHIFSVNRTFFDLAMNERYRNILISPSNLDKTTIRILKRLKYVPASLPL
jgi:hypothetical protein